MWLYIKIVNLLCNQNIFYLLVWIYFKVYILKVIITFYLKWPKFPKFIHHFLHSSKSSWTLLSPFSFEFCYRYSKFDVSNYLLLTWGWGPHTNKCMGPRPPHSYQVTRSVKLRVVQIIKLFSFCFLYYPRDGLH